MKNMISVDEAARIIHQSIDMFPVVECSLLNAQGYILQEDIFADRDQPPYNRVAMDGIAINLAAWKEDEANVFPIEGIEQAGQSPLTLKDNAACIEVMTGAVLPLGCDCVVPVENISVKNNTATIRKGMRFKSMQNVHPQGADYPKEAPVLAKGQVLQSPHIAVLAAVGKTTVRVSQQPKIAVFTTGNELIDIHDKPEAHQVRRSNSYAVRAALVDHGFSDVEVLHLQDDQGEIKEKLSSSLKKFDVHILSGGVSMGRYDLVPEVLNELGVEALFHKVEMRPGKPFWFGKTQEGRPIFALPGNPVSALTCCYRFVLPFLKEASGQKNVHQEYVTLKENFQINTPLTYFLPVRIESNSDGIRSAIAVKPNGSGDFVSLAKTDGFVELKEKTYEFPAGHSAPFYRW